MSTQTTCILTQTIYLLRILLYSYKQSLYMTTQTTCSYIYLLRVSLTLLLQTVPVYVNTNYLLLYIPTSHNLHSTPTNSPCICQHKLLAPIYTYFVYPSLYSYKQSLYMSTQTTCSYIYLLRVSLTLLLQTVPVYVNTNYLLLYIYLLRVSLTLLLQTVPVYVNTNYLLLYIPTSCILNSTPTNSPCICQHKLLAPIYTYFVYP